MPGPGEGIIEERLRAVRPERLLVAVDFDGTIAEIVADPAQARLLPAAGAAIERLVPLVLRVAILSGRPRAFLEAQIPVAGLTLVGDHGQGDTDPDRRTRLERFNGAAAAIISGRDGVQLEPKPGSTAIHFRRSPEAGPWLLARLEPLAGELGLVVSRGRLVIDVIPAGAGKAVAIGRLLAELDPGGVVFAGDDTGDQAALELVGGLALPHIAVGVASDETDPRTFAVCDLVVHGPRGTAAFLDDLAGWAEGRRGLS